MTGTQVSHFQLVRKLGAGTYGEVWEAVHLRDEELRVAVKVVAPALVKDPRFVEALKRECRQLDRLDHPNIVRFRDLVLEEGQVAMVLELLAGQDLHERLVGGPLPVDTAASVLEAILEGLAHAHARGVLHRDIKPGNVYWCDDGRVKLLDFGIARAADGTQVTKTGQMVGTFDYMAPERFDGQHGNASSDVYAVGLIAWELLTGRPACPEGEPGRKVKWHLVNGIGQPAQVLAAIPGCPPWMAEVIASLAALDVSERPADGASALALLREKRGGGNAAQRLTVLRPPPATVLGPAPLGSVPPVATSAPPMSVPPFSTGRAAPPATVLGPTLPASVPNTPPSPQPVNLSPPTAPRETFAAASSAPANALPKAHPEGWAAPFPPNGYPRRIPGLPTPEHYWRAPEVDWSNLGRMGPLWWLAGSAAFPAAAFGSFVFFNASGAEQEGGYLIASLSSLVLLVSQGRRFYGGMKVASLASTSLAPPILGVIGLVALGGLGVCLFPLGWIAPVLAELWMRRILARAWAHARSLPDAAAFMPEALPYTPASVADALRGAAAELARRRET